MWKFITDFIKVTIIGWLIGSIFAGLKSDESLISFGIILTYLIFLIYKVCKIADDIHSIRKKYVDGKIEDKKEN